MNLLIKRDRIRESLAYCQNARMEQCAFLASPVKKYQSRVFCHFMSKNLSTNCCHRLRRVNVRRISLHFDLPSLYAGVSPKRGVMVGRQATFYKL